MRESSTAFTRGVYTAPYLSEAGEAVIVAIDRQGRLRRSRTVARDESPGPVVEQLTRELDEIDPQPAGAA